MALDTRIPMMGQGIDTASPLAALSRGMAEKQQQDALVARQAEQTGYDRTQDVEKMNMLKQKAAQDAELVEIAKHKAEFDMASEEDKKQVRDVATSALRLHAMTNPEEITKFLSNPKNLHSESDLAKRDLWLKNPTLENADFKTYNATDIAIAQQLGAIDVVKALDTGGYTLGLGQKRFDAQNKEVASGPAKAPTGMTAVTDPITGEVKYVNAKPMPPSIAKQQDELIGDLRTAASLNADLTSMVNGIKEGKVDLGLFSNQMAKARNAGYLATTPESRNVSNLMSTLQRMRNDSLRLNKGTQTEGDATRAWAELLGTDEAPNIPRDNALLASALARIADNNSRAEQEKAIRIDTLRGEYGKEPLDMTKISDVKPSFVMEGKAGGWSVEEVK